MNDVKITIGNGGLGRDTDNLDVVSGLVIYTPLIDNAAFTAADIILFDEDDRTHLFTSLAEFEATTGITFNNSTNVAQEIWYHVKEYYRLNPNTKLYVTLAYNTTLETTPVPLTFTEISDTQIYANGIIRQFGVVANTPLSSTQVELIQSVVDNLFLEHMPTFVVAGFDTSAIALGSLIDLRELSSPSKNVSVVLLQDGDNLGEDLFTLLGYSIPAVGATLGVVALSRVNESIAWVQKFNMSGAGELAEPAFGDGTLVKDTLKATLNDIDDKGYLFGVRHVGVLGTYFNDNHTCDVITSDFAYIGEVRTINKAVRIARSTMLPFLNSPVRINPTNGQIDNLTISGWTNTLNNALRNMAQEGEVSAFEVFINPAQNVLLTSTVNIKITLVPTGTARNINVEIGYAISL